MTNTVKRAIIMAAGKEKNASDPEQHFQNRLQKYEMENEWWIHVIEHYTNKEIHEF